MSGFNIRKRGAKEWLIDILFPNICPFCNKVIAWDLYCCGSCFDDAGIINEKTEEKLCPVCGKFNCICEDGNIKYDRCYAAGFYEGSFRDAVLNFKFKNDGNAAFIFAEIIADKIKKDTDTEYDLITYVPMSLRKQNRRGWNQSENLARRLSEKLGIPMKKDILVHKYSDEFQHDRSGDERRRAASEEYFSAENISFCGEKIIICDDVLTTGTTMSRCAEILKEMGASWTAAAVCAVTVR